ncbi:hypothetical protein M9H77_04642 [Catharanthus roseus]|uniref:Uncharacterized protein n=1 Tax=Catharanthus roseus TaxID=4058 RepID=A0ACC0CF48_CATRO|nr:hypothetical protein M9H77_04642 [Catharanthus roseus]
MNLLICEGFRSTLPGYEEYKLQSTEVQYSEGIIIDRNCKYLEGSFPYFKGLADSVLYSRRRLTSLSTFTEDKLMFQYGYQICFGHSVNSGIYGRGIYLSPVEYPLHSWRHLSNVSKQIIRAGKQVPPATRTLAILCLMVMILPDRASLGKSPSHAWLSILSLVASKGWDGPILCKGHWKGMYQSADIPRGGHCKMLILKSKEKLVQIAF